MENATLTEIETLGLKSKFNFADGHAYHDLAPSQIDILRRLPDIWEEGAQRKVKEAERLYRETGNPEGEARAMFDQARLFFAVTGMAAAALPDMRKAQTLAQTHGLAGLAENIKQFADGIDRH